MDSRAVGDPAEGIAALAAAQSERRAKGGGESGGRERGGTGAGGDHAAGTEQERVGEAGQNFFDVVRDQDEGGAVFPAGECLQKAEKLFTGDGIQAGARLVENEQPRASHESAGDEDTLALALGEKLPLAIDETGGPEQAEEFFRGDEVGSGRGQPEIELGVAAADDSFDRRLGGGHAGLERAGDDTELEAEVAPIGFAVALAEEGDVAAGG